MHYDQTNTDRATVIDVEEGMRIVNAVSVDTAKGTVTVVGSSRLLPFDHVHFDAIHPIFGRGDKPCMFHCYGRQP